MGGRVICITHGEDADGLVCGAYLRRLKDATTWLASYDDFEETLRKLRPPADEVFVCDLNVRDELVEEILRINGFAQVTVIDHHPTASMALERLGREGVRVVFSPLDCAGALLFDRLGGSMHREDARLAAYAAISDQFEEGPIASRLLNMFDRQFVQHEALILSDALSREDATFRSRVVEELSRLTLPHRIPGAVERATAHLENVARLIEALPERAAKRNHIAYVEVEENDVSLGTVSNLLLDSMDIDIGISFKVAGGDAMNVSLRARRGVALHLGDVAKRLAEKHGGFGGGHSRASGARIPRHRLKELIQDLERELESTKDRSNTRS